MIMIQFVNLWKIRCLFHKICNKLILPDYASFLKPTVYMVAKEEAL